MAIFKQNLQILQRRVQAIYAANLVTIFGLIKKLQQFEIQSIFFKVNKLLNCNFDVKITALIFESGTQIH